MAKAGDALRVTALPHRSCAARRHVNIRSVRAQLARLQSVRPGVVYEGKEPV